MILDSAMQLKQELIARNYAHLGDNAGALRAEAVSVRPVLNRQLSVGLSRQDRNDYHLEIRLRKPAGNAYETAVNLKRKSPNEVHIGIIQFLRAPSNPDVVHSSIEADGHAPLCKEKRPLHLGLSAGHKDGGTGTLGAFVENSNNKTAILSNSHVFGDKAQTRICQPGDKMPRIAGARDLRWRSYGSFWPSGRHPQTARCRASFWRNWRT
jgi:hypothetical protein